MVNFTTGIEQFVVDALAAEISIEEILTNKKIAIKKKTIDEGAVKVKTINAPTVPPIPAIMRNYFTNTGLFFLTFCTFFTQAITKIYQFWLK